MTIKYEISTIEFYGAISFQLLPTPQDFRVENIGSDGYIDIQVTIGALKIGVAFWLV